MCAALRVSNAKTLSSVLIKFDSFVDSESAPTLDVIFRWNRPKANSLADDYGGSGGYLEKTSRLFIQDVGFEPLHALTGRPLCRYPVCISVSSECLSEILFPIINLACNDSSQGSHDGAGFPVVQWSFAKDQHAVGLRSISGPSYNSGNLENL